MHQQAASITALVRSFFSGAIVLQISGNCAAVLALQTRRRLRSSVPHCSVGVTSCLVGSGGGDAIAAGRASETGGFGLGVGKGVVGG